MRNHFSILKVHRVLHVVPEENFYNFFILLFVCLAHDLLQLQSVIWDKTDFIVTKFIFLYILSSRFALKKRKHFRIKKILLLFINQSN